MDIDSLDIGSLDITRHEIEFGENELAQFAQHPLLAKVLEDEEADLDAFASELEAKLREVEGASVEDYVQQAESFAQLHNEIESADAILASMEGLLSGFQAGLGGISAEIRNLQARSVALNIKLTNRKELSAQLQRAVDDMVVSSRFVHGIRDDPVDEQYMELLRELNGKIAFTQSDMASNTKAMQELVPALNELRLMAIAKVREFLLGVVYSFRRPKTNVQIVQTGKLLKYKELYAFVVENGRDVADEVRRAYEATIGKIYYTYFKWYVGAMLKLQTPIAHKTDLLGVKESSKRSFFSKAAKSRKLVFSLGNRGTVLDDINQPAAMPNELSAGKAKYPFEVLFRSISALVADTATTEYLFDIAFFGKEEVFHNVFTKATEVIVSMLGDYLSSSWDCIGILLCARISHMQQEIMARRSVPALENFLNCVRLMLWPRFAMVLNKHLESLAELDPRTLAALDEHALYITRRFAEFVAAIIEVNHGYKDLSLQLQRMTRSMEGFLLRASQALPDPSLAVVFLINNYDLILTILDERLPNAPYARSWRELIQQHIEVYAEDRLRSAFAPLLDFVHDGFPILAELQDVAEAEASGTSSDNGPRASVAELRTALANMVRAHDVAAVADTFAASWKDALAATTDHILTTFDNLLNSAEVIKYTVGQLLTYYSKFVGIIDASKTRRPKSLVDLHKMRHFCKDFVASKTDFATRS